MVMKVWLRESKAFGFRQTIHDLLFLFAISIHCIDEFHYQVPHPKIRANTSYLIGML